MTASITFTWSIKNMIRQPDTGFVTDVAFVITGINGTAGQPGVVQFSAPGTVIFTPPADMTTIVPYDSLTESQVLTWVQAAVPADQVQVMESVITNQINANSVAVPISGMPWSN